MMSEHRTMARRDLLALMGAGGVALAIAPVASPKAHAAGTNYYVDTGSAGTGTDPNSPWTLAQASGFQFAPGDTIHFRKGKTFSGSFVLKGAGTASAPITIRGDDWGDSGAANAVIDGGSADAITNVTALAAGSSLPYYNPTAWNNVSDWQLIGLELKTSKANPLNGGTNQYNGSNGIYLVADGVNPADNLYIDNIKVSQATGYGVFLLSTATGTFDHAFQNVKILNSTFYDPSDHVSDPDHPGMLDGIRLIRYNPSSLSFEYNHFDGFDIASNYVSNTLWDGIGVYFGQNGSVEGNYINAAGQMPPLSGGGAYWGSGSYGIRITFASHAMIQHNLVKNQGNSSADGDGGSIAIENGSSHVTVQYNITSGAAGHSLICSGSFANGAYSGTTSDVVFRTNYLHHEGIYIVDTNECAPGSSGCSPSDPVSVTSDCRIYDNTIIITATSNNWSRAALSFQLSKGGSSGNIVANNIFFVNNPDASIPLVRSYYTGLIDHVTFKNNMYWTLSGAANAKFAMNQLSTGEVLTFTDWQSYVSGATTEKFANPLLVDPTSAPAALGGTGDVHLGSGSPAVNAGTSIAAWLMPGEYVSNLTGCYPGDGFLDDSAMDIGAALA